MTRQLLAGYYSDILLNSIKRDYNDKAINATRDLLHSLSFFECDLGPGREAIVEDTALFSLLAVYHNYIQRGLPTHASVKVEEYLSNTWKGITKIVSDTGSIEYTLSEHSNDFTKLLFGSLFIVDPRIGREPLSNAYWRNWLGSDLEKRFLNEFLLTRNGNHWLQLVEPQRSIANILTYSYESGAYVKELYNQPIDHMGEQRVDFAVELPCVLGDSRKGLILEVDGSQHLQDPAQFNLDQYRDQAIGCLQSTQWGTLRARSNQWQSIPALLAAFNSFFEDPYFTKIAGNYQSPLYQQPEGLKALHLALTPIAVARIQKVLLELVFKGVLKLDSKVWRIGVVERDVDCAWIAVEDFKDFFQRLVQLSGIDVKLPEIQLTIFNTAEFRCAELGHLPKKAIEEAKGFKGDALLDVSVLQRWGLTEPVRTEQCYTTAIRSAHSKKELRKFISAPLIQYQSLLEDEEGKVSRPENVDHLGYIIQSAFRKESLRPGQLPIINKALQMQSVIGLLPTGGGKSLTYQVCSLLQPGTTVVIDPIKSLMQDQNEGLKRNDIDATIFINSSIRTFYERKWAQEQLTNGRVLFSFISPERLQIPSFRADLVNMAEVQGNYFSYCVIDEAHCVSEWGHDFRTSYLKLGENARKFCKTWKGKNTISLFGLTATASFDVLSDVKRELRIGDEGVVSSLSTSRKELLYQIHPVITGLGPGTTGYQASRVVGAAKVEKLKQLLERLPEDIHLHADESLRPGNFSRTNFYVPNVKSKYDHAVLVFCPHKSEKSPMGVNYVAPRIAGQQLKVGTFYGADGSTDNDVSLSEKNQTLYIKNHLNALVATKAFGMGIDKANVRSTIHFNFPSSIESFVQEAGRAGRDRKRAICHVLYSDASHIDFDIVSSFHANNFKGVEHDYEMMVELLHEITYPAQKVLNDIALRVFEELGEVVQVSPWQGGNSTRIYINRAFGVGYGYINSANLTKNLQNVHQDIGSELANEVLDFVIRFIQENCPHQDYFEWIQSEVVGNSHPGLEALLKKVRAGERLPDVEIGFRNNRVHMITQLLKSNVDERFTEFVVQKAAEYCDSVEDFYDNLIKEFRRKEDVDVSGKFPLANTTNNNTLKKYFAQVRDEIDTFKAVYRLTLLGVIDDYEVDYASKSIKVMVTKKPEEAYVHHLEDYLSRYLSPRRVNELLTIMKEEDKGTVLRSCAWALIKYVYDFVGKKRARALKEMQSICEIGVSTKDYDEIERTITLYFNSKYTSELLEMTNDGEEFSLEVLQHFIEETQGVGDNLEHLRGSAARILTDKPENGALLLLRAFASLLLETKYVRNKLVVRNQYLVDRALEDMENGLFQFEKNGYNLLAILNYVRKELLLQNQGLEKLIEEVSLLLSVKQHRKWLTNFNKKYTA